ncbi:MAG: hypothetical protein ACPGQV_05230 [Alphaproteobacteria bacterium]
MFLKTEGADIGCAETVLAPHCWCRLGGGDEAQCLRQLGPGFSGGEGSGGERHRQRSDHKTNGYKFLSLS